MATFVLVSGAWHAGWCWERLVPLLEAAGHRAIAPDLLGMGSDKTPLSEVTLARWADQIADVIRTQPEPVVLVGHSRGGIVISEAAERAPKRIAVLVYLTALLLPNGWSLTELMSEGASGDGTPMMQIHPDGTSTVAPEAVGTMFYNTTSPEWVDRARQQLGPEPWAVIATPLRLSAERYGRVPRAYIECALDRAGSLELQRRMQGLVPCEQVITLQTDHSPFYSSPADLAAGLIGIEAGNRL